MGLLEEFQEAVQAAEGRLVGDAYYGVWEQYPFTAYIEKLGGGGELSFEFQLERKVTAHALRELREAVPRGCRVAAEGSWLRLLIRGRTVKLWYHEPLGRLLDGFTNNLRRVGAVPPGRCPLCRQGGCDAYADVGGYVPVHRDCVEAMDEGRHRRPRSGFGGFLGALLGGGLVAMLILITELLEWPGVWLYFFLPLGAWHGCRLLGGVADRKALLWSGMIAVLDTVVIEQAVFYSYVHFHYQIWPSVLDSFLLYWHTATVGDLLERLWFPAACLLAGFLINWLRTRHLSQAEDKGPGYARATMSLRREP